MSALWIHPAREVLDEDAMDDLFAETDVMKRLFGDENDDGSFGLDLDDFEI